ncbi:LuxR C-terminal-related transcriptional regulator [Paraburkholderia sp. GAS334]|uniref:LuxR C-terminal-related transcriptional regulator n=1 Tax=Paraburkholderia sp. GAS334 TaxID=3035131 RepID=UPI003D1CC487
MLSRVYRRLLAHGNRCLWISLDDRDRDVLSLLALLRRTIARDIAFDNDELDATALADSGEMMDLVLGLVHRLPGKTVLFVDNVGSCDDSRLPVLLERLVFDSGPDLRLIISSNREVPIDLVRVKLELNVLELTTEHLSFDLAATRQLLRSAGFASLDAEALGQIQTHTEGWPAAVRLLQVLMSAEHGSDQARAQTGLPSNVLERFGGDQQDIARVLTHRVLAGLEPARVQFLMETALVQEFSAELAKHVTGCTQAHSWLDELLRRNLLIFPVDRGRRWFRFHTLLREYLVNEGKARLDPVRRKLVLQRVAQWHASRADYVHAIVSALDAPDVELAQDMIGRVAREATAEFGQMTLFVQWVNRLLAAGGHLPLEAQGWYVWALCHTMQYERARDALEVFDQRLRHEPAGDPDERECGADLSFLRSVLGVYLDTLDVARAEALSWLGGKHPNDPLRAGTVAAIAAMAEIDSGDLTEAQQHLDYAEGAISRSQSAFVHGWVAILRSMIELARARPDVADRLLTETRSSVAERIGSDAGVVATIDFVHARALVDLARFADARVPARRGLARANHHGVVASAELGLGACVSLSHDVRDDFNCDATLDRIARSYPPRVRMLLCAQRVRQQLREGRILESSDLAETCGLSHSMTGAPDVSMRERGDWLLARVELMISRGMCDHALVEIDVASKAAQKQGRQSDRIGLLLAAMDAHTKLGHSAKALRSLSMAVLLATPGQLMQPFLIYGTVLNKILRTAGPRELGFVRPLEISFLERIRTLVGIAEDAIHKEPVDAPAKTNREVLLPALTARETQLLHMINDGLSNQQIADRLCLTVPTVKWHLNNLYSKISVRNRSAALAKARAFGLFTSQ